MLMQETALPTMKKFAVLSVDLNRKMKNRNRINVVFPLIIAMLCLCVLNTYSTVPDPGHAAGDIGSGAFYGTAGDVWSFPGKVGIGVIGPVQLLVVAGAANVSGTFYLGNSRCAAGTVLSTDPSTGLVSCSSATGGSGSLGYVALWNSSSTLNNSVIYQISGRIGINTTNPSQTLTVLGGANVSGPVYLGNTKCAAGYFLSADPGSGFVNCTLSSGLGGNGAIGYVALWNSSATLNNSLIFQNSSFIGIGLNSPNSTLDVNGTIRIRGGNPGDSKVLVSDSNGLASWKTFNSGNMNLVVKKGYYIVASNPAPTVATISYGITYDSEPYFTMTMAGRGPLSASPPVITHLYQCNAALSGATYQSYVISYNITASKALNSIMLYRTAGNDYYACFVWVSIGDYSGGDLAEYYKTDDPSIEAGDVVTVDKDSNIHVVKGSKYADGEAIGVISTTPGQILSDGYASADDSDAVIVALAGRVPVKVSLENGIIRKGDYLTESSVPGVAMKATEPCVTIGKAMEDFDGTSTIDVVLREKAAEAAAAGLTGSEAADLDRGVGKVMAFLNVGYWEPKGYESYQAEQLAQCSSRLSNIESEIAEKDRRISVLEWEFGRLEKKLGA